MAKLSLYWRRANFDVRYVHKISPKDSDTGDPIRLRYEDVDSRRALGAALRKQGVLTPGQRIRDYREERDGKIVVFPSKSIWHSIILTPQG